jgi:hypothetical protein
MALRLNDSLKRQKKHRMALQVHMDSLWTYRRHVSGIDGSTAQLSPDPTYMHMMPRLVNWAEQRHAKLTIFVIAEDLSVPEHARLIRKWHADGHEIASHSWSHPPQFLALDDISATDQVRRAHDAIIELLGTPPVGYAAPGWYDDRRVWPILKMLGYSYDASLLPSWVMLLQTYAIWALSPALRGTLKLVRSDWRELIWGPTDFVPTSASHVMRTPTPVAWLRLPFWHSLAFLLPLGICSALVRNCIVRRPDTFYYVVHPLDFADPERDAVDIGYLRGQIPFEKKWGIWKHISDNFSDMEIVTMRELMAS